MVLAKEVVIVCLCLKDTEIHATSKQGNTTNSALESLHSLHRSPAAHPRLLGQRAFRLEARATLAVTHLDEAGRAGPHSSFPPLPDEARIDIYWLCNQM